MQKRENEGKERLYEGRAMRRRGEEDQRKGQY